jgi:coiled-coil domain-containing protein 55
MSLKYGLNIKSKQKQTLSKGIQLGAKRSNNPLEDSDEEDKLADESTKGATHQQLINNRLKTSSVKSKKVQEIQQKALDEDPNIYDYDAVYDDLKRAEIHKKNLKDGVAEGGKRKAKYMEDLIKASTQRKIYLERASQKKVQKEREAEAELYGDKVMLIVTTGRVCD